MKVYTSTVLRMTFTFINVFVFKQKVSHFYIFLVKICSRWGFLPIYKNKKYILGLQLSNLGMLRMT